MDRSFENNEIVNILMYRTKRLSEARVMAEQEINKFRKDFEEKYLKESERVSYNLLIPLVYRKRKKMRIYQS